MSDFKAKMHRFDLGWALPQTPLGKLTAFPQTLAGFKGPLRGREGKGKESGKGGERDGEGREQEGRRGGRQREGMDFGKTKNDSGATRFSFFLNLATGIKTENGSVA